jgi:hypothetical protein
MPIFSTHVGLQTRLARLLCLALSVCTWSCGGGAGSGTSSSRLQGYFKDSAVSGLSYVTSSNVTGITRPDGGFDYNPGDTITFSFGAIRFPTVSAANLVTPLNMADGAVDSPTLNNIAYLLQALDSDDNPDNGITLSQDLLSRATQSLDFTVPTSTFTANTLVTTLIAAKGSPTTTTAASALTHINWNLEQGFVDSTVIGPSVDCLYPDQGQSSADISLVKRVLSSANRNALNSNLWADVYAKPQNAEGWFFDATYTLKAPNPTGAFEPYQPTPDSPEIQAAMKSKIWHDYSLARDTWFKHRDDAKVQFRVAALKTYFGLTNQPEYIGSAIFLHYTGETNSYLELVFLPQLHSTVFFNFTSNNSAVLYNSTLGKDGVLGGGDDGWFVNGNSPHWASQHVPGDVNFPPNLRSGGTSPSGRQIPDGTCLIPAGGSALVWTRPSSRVDLFFSTIGVSTNKGTAAAYTDTNGYLGTVGLYSNENAIKLTVVKP